MIISFLFRSNRSSTAASTLSTSGALGLSEKTFLNPKKMTASKEVRDEKGPSLDDFDKEIEIYQVCLKSFNFVNCFFFLSYADIFVSPYNGFLH